MNDEPVKADPRAQTCVQFDLLPTSDMEIQTLNLVIQAMEWGRSNEPRLETWDLARIAEYLNKRYTF